MKNLIALALVIAPISALAQVTISDQIPAPVPSALNSGSNSELLLQSSAVTGGTIYTTILKQPGASGAISSSSAFVPVSAVGSVHYLQLTEGKSDLGVPMTAAAGTPASTPAITRVAGTSMVLTGETTSGAAAVTDKVMFEFSLPTTYAAGTNIPVTVNCNTSGTVITAASTTMTVAAYTETNGVEAAVTVSAAQRIPSAAGNLTFTVTGTGLVPGQHMVLELTMLVTTASGAGTGLINSISFQG